MTTKKRISRVFAVALAMVLMMALAVPSFAGVGGNVQESDLSQADTAHGHYFRYGKYALNQWG